MATRAATVDTADIRQEEPEQAGMVDIQVMGILHRQVMVSMVGTLDIQVGATQATQEEEHTRLDSHLLMEELELVPASNTGQGCGAAAAAQATAAATVTVAAPAAAAAAGEATVLLQPVEVEARRGAGEWAKMITPTNLRGPCRRGVATARAREVKTRRDSPWRPKEGR